MSNKYDIFPSPTIMIEAAKFAITQDKAIYLDYYLDTACDKAWIGEEKETKEKILIKSVNEYTDNIEKMYKVDGNDFIVITNNSIYIVNSNIKKRHFNVSSLSHYDNVDEL